MYCRCIFVTAALALAAVGAAPPKPGTWIQVQSPHFLVVSNAGAGAARGVAGQLEQMREVFQQAFPALHVDPPLPIEVLALKDRNDMRAVEPARYLGKGKLDLAGYFQRTEERNFILMRLDTQDEDHPYAVIYHEYTHLLTFKDAGVMPIWLAEGLAEFYQNTEVSGKDVSIGKPDTGNLELLRDNRLIPLATLFAVGYDSPYYNEETKGTIFYAESWALTHYLMLRDRKQGGHALTDYITLLNQNVDAVTAAARAFGDLGALQKTLDEYTRLQAYSYVRMQLSGKIDPKSYPAAPISQPQADAVRAAFMAHTERFDDARALLQTVLKEDPGNVAAMETMGYVESQQNHLAAARNWYGQAVAADSHSFLAQYFFAAMTMQSVTGAPDDATAAKIEASLQAAIRLSPSFAPSYDRLAMLNAERQQNLDDAYRLELEAIQLDPSQFAFRVNAAGILTQQDKPDDALRVLERALPLARSPEQTKFCQDRILAVEQYKQQLDQFAAMRKARDQAEAATQAANGAANAARETTPPPAGSLPGPPVIVRDDTPAAPPPAGPKHVVTGVIVAVRCGAALHHRAPAGASFPMEMDVRSGGRLITLTSRDYFRIPFSAVNFTPPKVLNPCTQLEGIHARIDAAGNQIVAVALSR